jgi:hypothetical protein
MRAAEIETERIRTVEVEAKKLTVEEQKHQRSAP